MQPKDAKREEVIHLLEEEGGLRPGAAARVHRKTGVPEADVYGVGTFYPLLSQPDLEVRVCQGLSCKVRGGDELMADLEATGASVGLASCVGRCDQAPALWRTDGREPPATTGTTPSGPGLAIDLEGTPGEDLVSLDRLAEDGPDWVIGELEAAGLTGRGGAAFPAHIKWRGLRSQAERERYVVLNADEAEPGTFKDREILLRRPDLVIEGLAVAARTVEAEDLYLYIRGEFQRPKKVLQESLERFRAAGRLDGLRWHFVDGHGAYICGEETALLESLEGRRGMPRMKPPFPVEKGFRNKPTLIQNVETVACIPAILRRGGEWWKNLGHTEPGTKLYCMSGHVNRPGVYEAPMGTPMAELLELAGGVDGTLKAFSPGGASAGFLPASSVDLPMDFASLRRAGSMLGSAGVVVLNETVDMVEASLTQAVFFEDESCGQCSPCRIGTQVIRQALERYRETRDPGVLSHLEEVMWGMGEASICGLGQAAFWPVESAMRYFPEEFGLGG